MKKILCVALILCLLTASASALVYETEDGENIILGLGGSYVYTRDNKGVVRVWGDNQYGQLGKGTVNQNFKVKEFKSRNEEIDPLKIKDIVATSDYSYLWMEDDTLWGAGNGAYLSLGKREGPYATHTEFKVPEKPVAMALGFGHSLILTETGHVYGWGRNCHGQVGNGKTRKTCEPCPVPVENIVQIAAGGKFSLALDADGVLWGWGDNEFHNLLPDTKDFQTVPVRVNTGDIDIAYIDACGDSVVLLDREGTLWTWGRNDMQQLGYDTNLKTTTFPQAVPLPLPVVSVAAYSSQTYAILSDGSLWSWGNNSYGQLGHGFRSSSTEGVLPAQCWDKDVVMVQGGSLFCVAVLKDGTVLSAGISKFGQLGEENSKSKYTLSPNGMDLIVD